MRTLLSCSLAMMLSLSFIACSKSSDTTSANNNNTPNSAGTNQIVETVAGMPMTFVCTGSKSTTNGQTMIQVIGVDTSGKAIVGLSLTNVTATGTYDIGTVTFSTTPQTIYLDYSYNDANGSTIDYNSTNNSNSKVGTITITSLSPLKATFSATLPLTHGTAASSVAITGGMANVTIN
ncbi:MAG: hypothetical protein JSS75_09020 [Bacteroidetes bacterium]|nr:hypothetical protein [Bacteroidota bacterium]